MNKNLLIGIGIVVVLLIVGGGIYAMTRKSSASVAPAMNQNKMTMSPAKMTEGTLKSLLSEGGSKKCTYTATVQSGTVDGTVYVANGKMRGDFTTKSQQETVDGHMIINNGYSYIWTNLSTQGIKMALNQMEPTMSPSITNVPTTTSQAPDLNTSYNYSCQGWTEDDSQFALPSSISFMSYAMPSGAMTMPATTGASSTSSECSVCNNIPAGTARNACMSQLHC